ncbi:MAG: hypothetical protein R8M14_06500 [Ghiorsea sp.]
MQLTKLPSRALSSTHLFQYVLTTLKGTSWLLFVISPWMLLALGCSLLGIIDLSDNTVLLITILLLAGLPQFFLCQHHKKEDNTFPYA